MTITFGRVTEVRGSRHWGRQIRVPHEPPMYWAHRGEVRPYGPDYWHYADTLWGAVFKALGRERRPLPWLTDQQEEA